MARREQQRGNGQKNRPAHLSLFPHFGHFDGGRTIDSPLNALKITTFKKLPIIEPITKTKNNIVINIVISGDVIGIIFILFLFLVQNQYITEKFLIKILKFN